MKMIAVGLLVQRAASCSRCLDSVGESGFQVPNQSSKSQVPNDAAPSLKGLFCQSFLGVFCMLVRISQSDVGPYSLVRGGKYRL